MNTSLIVGFLVMLLSQPHSAAEGVQPELSVALRWSDAALQGIRDAKLSD